MSHREDVSSLTLNRLSVYLRCLRQLQRQKVTRISSQELARRFQLSAAQIRKDLAQFGEFGIRGVGYQVTDLRTRLESLLGLDREHRAVVIGAGNLGTALSRFPGFNRDTFRIVATFDNDPRKVGGTFSPRKVGGTFPNPPGAFPAPPDHPKKMNGTLPDTSSDLRKVGGTTASAANHEGGTSPDPRKKGGTLASAPSAPWPGVYHSRDLARVVAETGAEIGILTVPAAAAQENYDALVAAGIQAVLNFAPVQLRTDPAVPIKNVDLMIFLEELAFFLR